MQKSVLIIGGTGPARMLAQRLVDDGHHVISSLAGVTSSPLLPAGEVRVGGFNGAQGLADYVLAESITLMIDATHPFAVQMSENAAEASRISGIPIVRLERPAWIAKDGDNWLTAKDAADAVSMLESETCAFVTIGRKEIGQFATRTDIRVVARMIEAPDLELPKGWKFVLARPPFTLLQEMELMTTEGVKVLVSKNSGGPSRTKLDAARMLDIPVIMIERPIKSRMRSVSTVDRMAVLVAKEK